MNQKNSWPGKVKYGHIGHVMATVGNTEKEVPTAEIINTTTLSLALYLKREDSR